MQRFTRLLLLITLTLLAGCKPVAQPAAPIADSATLTPTATPLPATAASTALAVTPTLSPDPLATNPAITVLITEPAGSPLTTPPVATPNPGELPAEWFISGVQSYRQSYPISCESRSAVDWADFFDVQIYESTFQFGLARSDNPDKGFVGDVYDPWGQIPPYSYGVHAAPVADLLKEDYALPARAVKGLTLDELKLEIASNQPVIAWVIGNMVAGSAVEYTDSQGDTVMVAPYEHSVIVTGYDGKNIRYLNNGRFFQVPEDVFLRSWEVLGNMALYYDESALSSD